MSVKNYKYFKQLLSRNRKIDQHIFPWHYISKNIYGHSTENIQPNFLLFFSENIHLKFVTQNTQNSTTKTHSNCWSTRMWLRWTLLISQSTTCKNCGPKNGRQKWTMTLFAVPLASNNYHSTLFCYPFPDAI